MFYLILTQLFKFFHDVFAYLERIHSFLGHVGSAIPCYEQTCYFYAKNQNLMLLTCY